MARLMRLRLIRRPSSSRHPPRRARRRLGEDAEGTDQTTDTRYCEKDALRSGPRRLRRLSTMWKGRSSGSRLAR